MLFCGLSSSWCPIFAAADYVHPPVPSALITKFSSHVRQWHCWHWLLSWPYRSTTHIDWRVTSPFFARFVTFCSLLLCLSRLLRDACLTASHPQHVSLSVLGVSSNSWFPATWIGVSGHCNFSKLVVNRKLCRHSIYTLSALLLTCLLLQFQHISEKSQFLLLPTVVYSHGSVPSTSSRLCVRWRTSPPYLVQNLLVLVVSISWWPPMHSTLMLVSVGIHLKSHSNWQFAFRVLSGKAEVWTYAVSFWPSASNFAVIQTEWTCC